MLYWLFPLLLAPATVKPVWTKKIGDGAGPKVMQAHDGLLLAVTWDDAVQAHDARTGKKLWSAKPPKEAVADDVAIAYMGDKVVIRWPEVEAVEGRDARTGKVAWTQKLPAPALNVVGCEEHWAAVVTHRGQGTLLATAIDPRDGNLLWSMPVDGDLAGGGGPYVFTAKRSGLGRLDAKLDALHCATGAQTAISGPDRPYVRFLDAADGRVAGVWFKQGFTGNLLCEGQVGDKPKCVELPGDIPSYPIKGAHYANGQLYYATQHIEAHNLNPAPDGWLFRYDLAKESVQNRSEPLTAGHAIFDAGSHLLTAFGTTGIDDFAYLVEPESLERVKVLPLKKGPSVVTADAERGYVGIYGGQVYALKLAGSGVKPKPRANVERQIEGLAQGGAQDDLGWTVLKVVDAHPKKGKTSGQKTAGTVLDLTFLDPAGKRLAIGGNDDRIHVLDVDAGKEVWKSKKLGKDVQKVQACASGTFAAQTYSGTIFVAEAKGKKYRLRKPIKHGGGWTFGFDHGCMIAVADSYEGEFKLYDAITGKEKASFAAPGSFDRRGVRVSDRTLLVSRPGKLELIDLADLREGPSGVAELATPDQAHSAKLVQAFAVNKGLWVREYCAPGVCVVEGVSPQGKVAWVERFDTQGGVWVPSVPSTIEIDPLGRWMLWHRDGLSMQLIALGKEKRRDLKSVARTMSGVPQAAFSRDGRRLALAMNPEPWQVTVLELK